MAKLISDSVKTAKTVYLVHVSDCKAGITGQKKGKKYSMLLQKKDRRRDSFLKLSEVAQT